MNNILTLPESLKTHQQRQQAGELFWIAGEQLADDLRYFGAFYNLW